MKKNVAILIVVFAIAIAIIGVKYTDKINDKSTTAPVSTADLSFAVLGDVHDNVEHFDIAINDLHTINPNMDALILNGDNVGQGLDKQYESLANAINKNKALLPKTIIKNIGNHEFFDYNIKVNSPEQVQSFIKKYLEFSGEKRVYHDAWVKGYHFISLGSEDGNSKTIDSVSAFLSDEQLKWFKDKISEKYQKGKPIFVFLHQPLSSGNGGKSSVKQNKQIKDILSKYPEAILFTSHTHRELDENSLKTDLPYTTVHTGAVHYTIIPDSNAEGGIRREPYVKGLYIEVNGNKVVVKGRDMLEKKWIFTKEINKK